MPNIEETFHQPTEDFIGPRPDNGEITPDTPDRALWYEPHEPDEINAATVDQIHEQIRNAPVERETLFTNPRMYTTATTTTTATEWDRNELEPVPVPEPAVEAPVFELQQNTQQIEIRTLQEQFPREVIHGNFQRPIATALNEERSNIQRRIHAIRQASIAKDLYDTAPNKHKACVQNMISNNFDGSYMRAILNTSQPLQDSDVYHALTSRLDHYAIAKREYLRNREIFGPQQARYQQRLTMIRQKPRTMVSLNGQEIAETISQWENVWGVCIANNRIDNNMRIRIGLCNIIMHDSAAETVYDYPAEILLAPFYFTIRISADGSFLCRSADGNVRGLSRHRNPGTFGADFHPHQLSDSPCFGTFGQSFIDMAHVGEIIPLISGLIAFYSQYNSEDSAGVSAQMYHPAHIAPIEDIEIYKDRIISRVIEIGRFHTIDENKLAAALERYERYHMDERGNAPPERLNQHTCSYCEDADVSDDTEYYISAHGERICPGCWADNFCDDCEHHHEDCNCDHDDDY